MNRKNEIQGEINALKQLLENSDYKAIKHSEGEMSEEEFAPVREQRQAWRVRINELEERTELQEERIKVANHRIDDLENAHKM